MEKALDFLILKDSSSPQHLVDNLFAHHLLVVGQTGSGKTTTVLSILSQLQRFNQTAIVLDPTGEYAKLPNAITYRLGDNCNLPAGKLTVDQLLATLQLTVDPLVKMKIRQAVTDLQIQHNIVAGRGTYRRLGRSLTNYRHDENQLGTWASDYVLQDLFAQLVEEFVVPFSDERANYKLLGQQYDRQAINHYWPFLTMLHDQLASPTFRALFATSSPTGSMVVDVDFILKMFLHQQSQHRTLVLDLSLLKKYEASQRLVLSLLLKEILYLRLQGNARFPMKVVIDEAHRYLPADGRQLADNGIFQVLREGRKAGLKMILTTQSPLDLPVRLRAQFSNILIHRLVDETELQSLHCPLAVDQVGRLSVGSAYLQMSNNQPELVKVTPPQWWQKERNEVLR